MTYDHAQVYDQNTVMARQRQSIDEIKLAKQKETQSLALKEQMRQHQDQANLRRIQEKSYADHLREWSIKDSLQDQEKITKAKEKKQEYRN
jgi:hypothetical protein